MRITVFLPLLLACSSSSALRTPSDAAVADQKDASMPEATTDVDGSMTDASDAYMPAGFTLVPFLVDGATTHKFAKADQVIDPAKDYVAVLNTDVGRMVWEMMPNVAPIAVNSFVFLTLNHFFDGIAFHRVIDEFMAQGGDPNSLTGAPKTWGTGGPGYAFGLEVDPSLNFDAAGLVAMANTGKPNSNGSQFFVTFVAYPSLNQQYTIFAKVIEGIDVLPNILRGEPPAMPTRIADVSIGVK